MTESLPATAGMLAAASAWRREELDYDPSRSDCVISLSSVPSRIDYLKPVIGQLMRQTVLGVPIELHLAHRTRSTGETWPPLPDWLTGLRAVRIVWHKEDPGPSLKYLGALGLHGEASDPLIVVVDDDVLYPRELVASLVEASTAEAAAGKRVYCLRGWSIHRTLSWDSSILFTAEPGCEIPVAVVTGHGGYAIRPSLVGGTRLWTVIDAPDECRMMDDIWISGHLSAWGVRKLLIDSPRRYRIMTGSAIGGDRARRNEFAFRYFKEAWRSFELV